MCKGCRLKAYNFVIAGIHSNRSTAVRCRLAGALNASFIVLEGWRIAVFPILAILLMVAIDQAVKYWASTYLQVIGTIPVLKDIFHLTYIENYGAAFSILQDKVVLFILLTIAILCAIFIAIRRHIILTTLGRWSLYIIAGGAIGNLIDRIIRGYVVDMFDFRAIHFPVFNIADIFVCIGGVLFIYYFLIQHDRAAKK